MIRNLHLAAIVTQDQQRSLQRIPLDQALQDDLTNSWQEQYTAFMDGRQEIDFNAGYKLEKHECFCLQDFDPPNWLAEEDSQTVSDNVAFVLDQNLFQAITGIAAFVLNSQNEEVVLFQNFSHSRVIQPGRFLFLEANTYRSSRHSGLTLDNKLSAVYLPGDRKLLFKIFRFVNTFLPLGDLYEEVSEQEIRALLNHDLLETEDPDAIVAGSNQWSRKRFAMLRDSGVLDRYSAQELKSSSEGCEVSISISNGKIVFPSDKSEARKLLQFLNEERFRGAITNTLYETNSKKYADQ